MSGEHMKVISELGKPVPVDPFYIYSWPKTTGRPYERKETEVYGTQKEAEQAAFRLVHEGKATSASVVQMKPVTLANVRYDECNHVLKMTNERTVRPDEGR